MCFLLVVSCPRLPGRYFFYNCSTKKTAWSLNPSFLLGDALPRPEAERLLPEIGLKGPKVENATALFPPASANVSSFSHRISEKKNVPSKPKSEPLVTFSGRAEDMEALDNISDSLVVVGGLGQGGFADVVQVNNSKTGAQYAMKVIAKRRLRQKKNRDRLFIEHRLMTEMAPSPFLQKCHFSFESQTNIFLVVDLITCGDLCMNLKYRFSEENGAGIPESECRVVLAELALALKHLHEHGYLHKDVKLDNVMLDHRGHVKLVDFGLAEAIKADVGPVEFAGSIAYFAPELIRSCTGGRHTDWWAFGIVAFELLSGCTPWSSQGDLGVIQRDILCLPIEFPLGVSDPATSFLRSLLQREYTNRLGTGSDNSILCAKFFEGIDWVATARLESAPAFLPDENTTDEITKYKALASYVSRSEISTDEKIWFAGFEKVTRHPRFQGSCALPKLMS